MLNHTFELLLKTLLKELFTDKEEILSCKSVKPCKKRKNSRTYYVRTRDKSGSNSPPFKRNVQIPPSPGTMHSQMPGVCPGYARGGGVLKFRIDRRIKSKVRRSAKFFEEWNLKLSFHAWSALTVISMASLSLIWKFKAVESMMVKDSGKQELQHASEAYKCL